jgi:hypothetical protein
MSKPVSSIAWIDLPAHLSFSLTDLYYEEILGYGNSPIILKWSTHTVSDILLFLCSINVDYMQTSAMLFQSDMAILTLVTAYTQTQALYKRKAFSGRGNL